MDIKREPRLSRGDAGGVHDLKARLIAGRARGALPRRQNGRADTGHGQTLTLCSLEDVVARQPSKAE